jgi:hypothetical protein
MGEQQWALGMLIRVELHALNDSPCVKQFLASSIC